MYQMTLNQTVASRQGSGTRLRFGAPTNSLVSSADQSQNQYLVRRQTCPRRMSSVQMVFVVVLSVANLFLLQGLARAQGTFQGDTQGCAYDSPCFNGSHQVGNTVVFNFTGTCCWDFYNVRYAQVGGGDKQVENRSGTFTFKNVKPSSVYTISVQGCKSHTLAHSTCTSWTQASVTTAAELSSSVRLLPKPAAPLPAAPVEPVKTIGRVNVGHVTPSQQTTSRFPICDSARSARARNSPAAPTLEAQCRAQGGDPSPVVAPSGAQATPPEVAGRVDPVMPPQPLREPVPICDAARSARARNSPAAPRLEARCLATGGDPSPVVETFAPVGVDSDTPTQASLELAKKGSLTVSVDMLLTAMRNLEPQGPRRLGFETGVAIGADQTLWGPGKQAMIDSLPETEKYSAEKSAHFVVARNANAKFASDGARIAEGETRGEAITARSAEPAGYYTLGFDIGAGIFASIARGGAGHTLPGPGSASIRNSLPAPGVRGFDAAMNLYMGK